MRSVAAPMRSRVLIAAFLLGTPGVSRATTWSVPEDANTIQEGIDLASVGDTIQVACGTYLEKDITLTSGIVIRSETGSPDCVTVDGEHEGRVFLAEGGVTAAVLEGLLITGGKGDDRASEYGGGIYVSTSSLSVVRCVFVDNRASGSGGGILCQDNSTLSVEQSTFYQNVCSGEGAGIYVGIGSHADIQNSLISDNQGTGLYVDAESSASTSCCDIHGNWEGDWIGAIETQLGTDGNISQDPLICDPYNGFFALRSNSPCLPTESGTCGVIGAMAGGCGPETMNYGVGHGGDHDFETIRAAMAIAIAGDTISLAPGTYRESGIRVKHGVTLRGESEDASVTTVDGEGKGRVLEMEYPWTYMVDSPQTRIENLTITGGNAAGAALLDRLGGGMLCGRRSSPAIDNCEFVGNAGPWQGGALFCVDRANPTVSNTTFRDNSASYGGAVRLYTRSQPEFVACTFEGNTALLDGGALYCNDEGVPNAAENCVFRGNRAGRHGGAVYDQWIGRATYRGCLFIDNEAISNERTTRGGAIYGDGRFGHLTLRNCTLWGNAADEGGGVYAAGKTVYLEKTIISHSESGTGLICNGCLLKPTCSNIFGNVGGDWDSHLEMFLGVDGNFSADPLYCGPHRGVFDLASLSPCLPLQHPTGEDCGLVGAFGLGCKKVATLLTGLEVRRVSPGVLVSWTADVSDGDALLVHREDTHGARSELGQATQSTPRQFEFWDQAAPRTETTYSILLRHQDGTQVWLASTTVPAIVHSTWSMTVGPSSNSPVTSVAFVLEVSARVKIDVFDVRGRQVRTLSSGDWAAGGHNLTWDGRDHRGEAISGGVYLVRFVVPEHSVEITRKTVVLR